MPGHDHVGGRLEEGVRVEFEGHRTRGHVMGGQQLRVQLAGIAQDLAGAERQLGGPSRVEGLVLALADHDLDAEHVAGGPGDVQGVGPVPRPGRVAGGGRRVVSGEYRGEVQRLVRDAVVQAVQHLVAGLDAKRRDRGGAERVARQEHQAGLEQGQVAEAARVVALGDLDQARQDRGAQVALLLADRVGQLERLARRSFRGHAERVIGGLGDERVRQDLGEAGIRQGLDAGAGAAAGRGSGRGPEAPREGSRGSGRSRPAGRSPRRGPPWFPGRCASSGRSRCSRRRSSPRRRRGPRAR